MPDGYTEERIPDSIGIRGMKPEAPVLKAKNETRKAVKVIAKRCWMKNLLDER